MAVIVESAKVMSKGQITLPRDSGINSMSEPEIPGSYLTATQGTLDGHSPDAVAQVEAVYRDTPTPIYFRDHATITRFFDGYDLVEPGLVTLDQWRPDHNDPAPQATNWMYGGVGHKP